jgi:Leucine-rich repeat (LRR) protein
LSVVANLPQLKKLVVGGTSAFDLAPLARFSSLQHFETWQAEVRDVTPLGRHYQLQRLYLANTGVKDLRPLSHLKNLELLSVN